MTRVLRKTIYPDTSTDCVLCYGGEENCIHLFFQCPFTHKILATQQIPSMDASGTQSGKEATDTRKTNACSPMGNIATSKCSAFQRQDDLGRWVDS